MGYRVVKKAVLIGCQRVVTRWHPIKTAFFTTDGRTDRQTDVQPISITCSSIADARKYQYFRSDFKSKSKIIRVIKNHDFKSNDTGVNIS